MLIGLPKHSLILMSLVVVFLCVASWVTENKIKQNPKKDYTELKQRVVSWWWMIGILFFCFSMGFATTIVMFAVISFLALKEFFSIVPLRQVDRRVVFWVYLALPVHYYWIAIGWYSMFLIFIPVYLFLIIPIRMVLLGETDGFIRSAGVLQWGAMLTIFCISHLAMLSGINVVNPEAGAKLSGLSGINVANPEAGVSLSDINVVNPEAGALGLVLFVLLLTQFNDVMQYVWGKQFGKHKVIPKVSPNKTWEGFLGGLASTAMLASLLGVFLTPMNVIASFIAGIIIAVAGFLGDVVFSSVKRDLAIKDSGNLIPGHGGILDRIDSLTFAAPLFFHYYSFFFA